MLARYRKRCSEGGPVGHPVRGIRQEIQELSRLDPLEERLYQRPKVSAPTVVLQARSDPLYPASFSDGQQGLYTCYYERRPLKHVGHNVPKEAPAAFILHEGYTRTP
jgi:hypothetical protein